MSPPELFGDIALHYLADLQRRQREGAPMKAEHDPQVLAARLHLRPHLIRLLDAVDMPEPLRAQVADVLLAAGDISRGCRPDIAAVDGEPVPVLVHEATLTIRHTYLGVGERAETAEDAR